MADTQCLCASADLKPEGSSYATCVENSCSNKTGKPVQSAKEYVTWFCGIWGNGNVVPTTVPGLDTSGLFPLVLRSTETD